MPIEAGKIRNVAVVGHRGTGKTSLVEAMLFQAQETNRLGAIDAGTTVSDWEEDEQRRAMSLAASLCHCTWQGRKLNLIDTPGDSGFQADTLAALRVVEGAIVVVSGVMGVEVNTARVWERAEELGLSRVVFVNMLDRERADFYRVLGSLQEQLSPRCIAVQLPIGTEHALTGIVDLLHNCAYEAPGGAREGEPVEIPAELAKTVERYRTELLDTVVETDEALMERYLGGEEIPAADIAAALKNAVTRDEIYPVACGIATQNLGTHALLDLLVEGVPSPAKKGSPIDTDATVAAFVFKTVADPFAGRINVFRVYAGEVKADTTLVNHRDHSKERLGGLMLMQGKEHERCEGFGPGDIGAVAKLKAVQTGDVLVDAEHDLEPPSLGFPEPVLSFAVTAKTKGDEDKIAQALRRLGEEDPTLRLQRDQRTGEELLSGMSQVHVEVAVERARRRFGVELELHQPRVPYVETIKGQARAQGRYKKQTGGRGQFGDCHIVLEPLDDHVGYE
nr:elongation factor G [Actinomycetota bacterium]